MTNVVWAQAGPYELVAVPMISTVRIYDRRQNQSYAGKTPYTTSLLITDLEMGECRLHMARGDLDDHTNIGMYQLAKKLGFRRATLEVPEGTKATRMGKFVCNIDGLDRYTVDIV